MDDSRIFVIDTGNEKTPAHDYAFLRQRGIEMIQKLCGNTWTDYNLHDPGITILEALCFAITDLAYRTGFPITDILSRPDGLVDLQENCFFVKEDILTSNPVTVNDFRKAMLDEMEELYNVWLEPVQSQYAHKTVRGLYKMTIQVKKEVAGRLLNEAGYERTLKQKALAAFVAKRNIAEDIVQDIQILKPVPIRITAEVMIGNEMMPEHILAAIYKELEFAINPPARYYTEEEMLDMGYRPEDIYAGPLLKKGFIPGKALKDRRREIDPAGLVKAISTAEGVVYVKNLFITAPGVTTGKLPYILDENAFPYFEDNPATSSIRLFRDKYEMQVREAVFRDTLVQVQEAAKRSYVPSMHQLNRTTAVKGNYRDIAFYHSLQHFFPLIYGISREGVPSQEPPDRKAKAKQLKAYLLFFEQVLANYLAQLANTRKLFSAAVTGDDSRTFFHQPLYNVPGVKEILKAFTNEHPGMEEAAWEAFVKDEHNAYNQMLKDTAESTETFRLRKNRLLDHLLARFNEKPSDYPVTLYNRIYGNNEGEGKVDTVIRWKAGLLRDAAILGHNRVKGLNYIQQQTDFPVSDFGNRMARLLFINNYPSRALTAVFDADAIRFSAAAKDNTTGGHTAGHGSSGPVYDESDMRQLMQEGLLERTGPVQPDDNFLFRQQGMSFFRDGMDMSNYRIGPDMQNGEGHLLLFKEPSKKNWQTVGRFADEAAAMQLLKQLVEYLKQVSKGSEGFYIVEHVLLRPLLNTPSFGFRFYGSADNLLLQHHQWITYEDREKLIGQILDGAGDMQDESIRVWKDLCKVQLQKDKASGLMINPGWLSQMETEEAAGDYEYIRHYLQLYRNRTVRFYPKFRMLVKGPRDQVLPEDFFHFSITVVLPAWPARFQDENFRIFLEDLFRQQAPAHLSIHFQWLNISRMRTFEPLYAEWMEALSNPADMAARQAYSERMIAFLKKDHYGD